VIGTTDGLGVVVDQGRKLLIDFAEPVTSLSFDFGHDSPFYWKPGAEAVLHVFAEADAFRISLAYQIKYPIKDTQLAEVRVLLNRDRVMNQSISVAGVGAFRRALFRFVGEDQPDPGLSVDNLRFETVPEPGTLGFGALLLATAARPHRRSSFRHLSPQA